MAIKCGKVPEAGAGGWGEPSGEMRYLTNEVRMKALGTYSKVVLGSKSYPEHSGWKDKFEVREQKLQGTERFSQRSMDFGEMDDGIVQSSLMSSVTLGRFLHFSEHQLVSSLVNEKWL